MGCVAATVRSRGEFSYDNDANATFHGPTVGGATFRISRRYLNRMVTLLRWRIVPSRRCRLLSRIK